MKYGITLVDRSVEYKKNLLYWHTMVHQKARRNLNGLCLGLQTHGEEMALTLRPTINSHSQIFNYERNILCLPHRPKFSNFFDLCLHWVSVVRALGSTPEYVLPQCAVASLRAASCSLRAWKDY